MKSEGYKSIPARFGELTENILYECPVYKIYVPSDIIDYYLPDKRLAFRTHT